MYRITSPLDQSINGIYRTLKDLKAEYPGWFAYYRTIRTANGLQLRNGQDQIIANIFKEAPAHKHDWFEVEGDTETIYWCHGCDATKDSGGGIIN